MTYKLKSDGNSWQIVEISSTGAKSKCPGTVIEKPIKFCASLDQAAQTLFDVLSARNGAAIGLADAKDLVSIVHAARDEVRAILKEQLL